MKMTELERKFVEQIATAVRKIAPEFGITIYSPVIAQAILESGWGTSNKAMYNNFFGLKYRENRLTCHSGTFVDGSKEQNPDGSYIDITDQWYKFNTLEDGVRGYFQFINIDRYKNLKGITDPKKYLETIKSDGYATSLNYVDNVYRVITNNNLTIYDAKEEKPMANNKKFKVHLDAGHYSKYNQSPVVKSYYESEMNWKLVNYLSDELTKRGIEVTKSRADINKDLGLYDRGYGAKGCDLFLSIHSNACGKEYVDYPVVYRGFDKTEADEFGLKLAKLIQSLMNTTQNGRTNTRLNSAGNGEYYGVLRGARAAGLTYYYIVEHSFHTNTKATNWLLNDNNLKELAKKEAELITSYFNIQVEEKKEETKPTTPASPAETKYYRVRKSWNDAKSQLGAYTNIENAKKACKTGYFVYDWNGKQVYPEIKKEEPKKETVINTYLPGTYKVTCDVLNIRKGPGIQYIIAGTVKKGTTCVINEVKNSYWGKLANGRGWISIHKNYCTKVSNVTTISATSSLKKSNETIALEVINGKWGNGATRKAKLTAAGYDYTTIQKLVNKLLS